jgi:predicted ATPase/class 3 adenylate cyclase
MICPNCQANNPCEARFCMNCGIPLVVICQNCTFENMLSANFCNNCGFSLREHGLEPIRGQGITKLEVSLTEAKEYSMRKFIPRDFAEKLEQARSSQTMKGERRIVSILFCDVKGSTSMAEQLDPEEWTEIMNQAFEYLISPIYTYEGTLARLMGDSVLAFFGAPIAHEDDAKRAILAGLKIVKDIQPFKDKINQTYNLDFDVRVGINTGLVVVGGVGSDLFMEYTALGDAINIASRMEESAEPGTIQIGEDTFKQAAAFFDFEQMEPVPVKGKAEPVKAYRVLGVKEKPFDERSNHAMDIPLIGRTTEMSMITHAIDAVQKGSGQIVCLIGEAGLGKSRLLIEARKIWDSTLPAGKPFGQISTRWNQASGLSYESSRPYGLIQRLIRNYVGLSPNDSPDRVREKIRETLSMIEVGIDHEWLDLFDMMLGVKEQGDMQDLSGESLKRMIYSEMLKTLELLVREGPTVLVLDDLHWSDPASAEFLVHLFQLADQLPIMFVCSFRPHHKSQAWMVKQSAEMDYAHRYTQINLQPLAEDESNQLVDSYLSGAELPKDVRRTILRKAEGNPFFMEEMIRGLIDDHVITHDPETASWQVNSAIKDLSVPENLSALITARIDRLEETSKHVLQLAAVIGRTFYYQVLDRINDVTDDLDAELVKLQRMGLIREVSRDPELEYIFRQALTQETAYNTVLIKHRREYHRRVGETILTLYPDRVEEYSALLGHHFYQAQDSRAYDYFRMEGDAALRLYANLEAIDYYGKAIEVANWNGNLNLEELSRLFLNRGRAYELESQFKEALACYQELEALAIKSEDKASQLEALIAKLRIYSVPSSEFNLEEGTLIVERAQAIAVELEDFEAQATLHWISMNLNRFHQSLGIAQQEGEKAIDLARELGMEELLAYSLNDTAHAYSMNGQFDRAKEVSIEASTMWRKMNNLPMLADSIAGLAAISVYLGEYDQAYEYSDQAYTISQNINNIWGLSYSRYAIGLVDLERGDFGRAIANFKQTIHDAKISKFRAGEVLSNTFLIVVYSEIGDHKKALSIVEDQRTNIEENLIVTWAFSFGSEVYALAKAGEFDKALKIVKKFRMDIEGTYFIARYYFHLGRAYINLASKDYQAAVDVAEEFLEFTSEIENFYLYPELMLISGIAYMKMGLTKVAMEKFEEGIRVATKLESRKNLWLLKYYQGKQYKENGDDELARESLKQAVENVQYILDHIEDDDLKQFFRSRNDVQELKKFADEMELKEIV